MKANRNYLQIEQFITKLELSAEKINVLINDIAIEYFDLKDENIKIYTFNRTRIKVDIIIKYIDNLLLDLEEFDNFQKQIHT